MSKYQIKLSWMINYKMFMIYMTENNILCSYYIKMPSKLIKLMIN